MSGAGTAYPLQALQDLRCQRRDAAQEALAALIDACRDSRRRLEEAERRVEEVEDRLAQGRDNLYAAPAEGVLDVALIDSRRQGLDALGRLLEARRAQRQERLDELEAAEEAERRGRAELTVAARELEALEKHRDRWQQRLALEARRREAKAIDEIVTSAYARGGAG